MLLQQQKDSSSDARRWRDSPPSIWSGKTSFPDRREAGGSRARLAVLGTLLALGLVRYAVFCWQLGRYPFEYEDTEGSFLAYAELLRLGQAIYSGNDGYPILLNIYPPLYPWLWAQLTFSPTATLAIGRAISIVASGLVGWLIYRAVRTETGSRYAGAVAALVFYVSEYIVIGMALAKSDGLYVALSLGALYAARRSGESRRWLVASGVMLVAAMYTKQFAFALVVPLAVYLWMRDRRAAVALVAGIGACALAILGVLQSTTGGWYWNNTVVLPKQIVDQFGYDLFHMTALVGFYVVNAGLLLWMAVDVRAGGRALQALRDWSIWRLALAVVLVQTTLASLQVGSWFTYLILPFALTCIEAGIALGRQMTRTGATSTIARTYCLIGAQIVLILAANHAVGRSRNVPPESRRGSSVLFTAPTSEFADNGRHISNSVHQARGDALAFGMKSFVVLNQKPILFAMDGGAIAALYQAGLFAPDLLLKDLDRKRFGVIVGDLFRDDSAATSAVAQRVVHGRGGPPTSWLNALPDVIAAAVVRNYEQVDVRPMIRKGHWVKTIVFVPRADH